MKYWTDTKTGHVYRIITEPNDLDSGCVATLEQMAEDGWDQDESGRVYWESFLERFETMAHVCVEADLDGPLIRRIKKIVRAVLKEMA